MRIISQWHGEDEKELEEVAGAVAFNGWKLGRRTLNDMQQEQVQFESYSQGLDVLSEIMAFLVQVADRLVWERMEEEDRQRFSRAMAIKAIEMIVENRLEHDGPNGDHRAKAVALFNQRFADYAEFGFNQEGPSYPFLRYLGARVGEIMGEAGPSNRWTADMMVDVYGPKIARDLQTSLDSLLGLEDST